MIRRGNIIGRRSQRFQALSFALVTLAGATPAASQQPCNPVIDGTYCATQMRPGSSSIVGSGGAPQIQSLSSDLSIGSNPTATFGALTFSGSGACIGILRGGACN
jgi:hypothetical protein